jgi:hypothetical protein
VCHPLVDQGWGQSPGPRWAEADAVEDVAAQLDRAQAGELLGDRAGPTREAPLDRGPLPSLRGEQPAQVVGGQGERRAATGSRVRDEVDLVREPARAGLDAVPACRRPSGRR